MHINSALLSMAAVCAVTAANNPVLPGLYADPNIAIFGKNYYIYPTTDGYPGWSGNQFYVWKSPDLVDWTPSPEPFLTLNGTNGNVPWATGNAWAPTIIERARKYYFYHSGQNPTYDRKTIGVAVAESPEGPFVARPTAMIINSEEEDGPTTNQAIDPAAYRDPTTGKYWLLWGNGVPLIAQLSDNMTSLLPNTTRALDGLVDFREGLFLNYRGGVFHLTYSIDDTRSEDYRVGYATAKRVEGPYTYHGVVLSKNTEKGILGTGHNSVVNVPGTDVWYMAYHRFAIPDGNGTMRETCIDRVEWDAETGLMNVVVPTLEGVEAYPIGY